MNLRSQPNRKTAAFLTSALFLLTSGAMAHGADIRIKPDGSGDQPTIQAGINAAANGDVVLLDDGVYTGAGNKNLDFNPGTPTSIKNITVKSVSDNPTACTIDCENSGRGFLFDSGETSASVVRGITITKGGGNNAGGAIYNDSSSPTITNCIFIG